MKQYGERMSDVDLNSLAWGVFQGCPDMTCVSDILDWSVQLKRSNNPEFMDTYANILYKMGRRDDAIALEQQAVGLAASGDKADLRANLDKMQKNEKTWN